MRRVLEILTFAEIDAMESILFHGGASDRFRRIGCFAFLLRGAVSCILVDTGIKDMTVVNETKKGPRRWTRTAGQTLEENLARLGVTPAEVEKVILTHSHYDHISNLPCFERAEVYLSAQEYEYLHEEGGEASAHLAEAKDCLDALRRRGNLVLVGDRLDLEEGISLRWVGGHTPGSQMVFADTDRGGVLITGDAVFLRENVKRRLPIGLTRDSAQSAAAVELCAAFPGECLPSHDLSVLSLFKGR